MITNEKDVQVKGKPGNYHYYKGEKGSYLIWWVLGALGQIGLSLIWLRREVNWKAAGITMLIFVPLMVSVETVALYWGWWVYNEKLIWGIRVGLLPLEELLLILVVVPAVVLIQALIMKIISKFEYLLQTKLKNK